MNESEVIVGRIVRAHGLRGDLVVQASSDSDLFFHLDAVTLVRRGLRKSHQIVRVREQGKALVVALDGIVDRNAAEAAVGSDVAIDRAELPPPGDDEVYIASLMGLPVVSPTGEVLGKVVEFEESSLQSWLVVESNGRESLVPFTEPLIRVELEAGRIVLDAPEGLLS